MTSTATAGIFDADRRQHRAPASPASTAGEALQAGDSRADNRRRSVTLSRERVTIDRSYRGIAMRLSVPVSAYRGVCVGVRAGEQRRLRLRTASWRTATRTCRCC